MSAITTHILDTARGRPAAGVPVLLERCEPGQWSVVGEGKTDGDGRLKTLTPAGTALVAGVYRISFDTRAYFATLGVEGFYPEVTVVFEIREPTQHYHVPLLISPYSYSTYRGS